MKHLNKNKKEYLQNFIIKLQYFKYSKNTIDSYSFYLEEFLINIECAPSKISSDVVKEYLLNYSFSSSSKQNQIISAIKFFWIKVLNKKYIKIDFQRPRKEKKLPRIIDAEILAKNIRAIKNIKHRTILALGLSCGLRVSEVINLKWEHLDKKEKLLNVINGKGKKDRFCRLNENMIELLYEYYKKFKTIDTHLIEKQHVFVGQNDRLQYSASSIQNIVKKHIHPKASYHILRHSHATYAVDEGTPLPVLQKELGHTNPNTTSIYLHLSNKSLNQLKQAI